MRRSSIFILSLVMIVAAAWLRAASFARHSQFMDFYGQKVDLRGRIVADPEIKSGRMNLIVRPDADGSPGEFYTQKILVTVFSGKNFEYGDELYIRGKITEPKSSPDFDYADYLAAKDIYGQMFLPEVFVLQKTHGNPLIYYGLRMKHYLFGIFLKIMPPAEAGLLIALISGNKNYMQPDDVLAFNNVGVAHMIAVSGYKLTLVFIALEALHPYLGRRKVLALASVFGAFYLIMADFAPAVIRAAVMSGLFLAARTAGRKYYILPALLLTAALLLLNNPLLIKYDVGFILSFVGIAGIIFFAPIFNLFFKRIPSALGIKEIFVSSVSAQIATAPIMAYFFHQFSPVAPLTNLLTVPFLAPVILAGYFCALPVLGQLAAYALKIPLDWMFLLVKIFAAQSFSNITISLTGTGLFLVYAVEVAGYFVILRLLKSRGYFGKIN